jgi:murein DD-endopeptidase MepM/ murein hydrolase activator NlpD
MNVLYILAAIGAISFLVTLGLGFSYAKMAFHVADYNKLQAENVDLKVQKKNLEVSTVKLDTKLTALENLSEKLATLIQNDSLNKRFPKPAVGGSKVDYPTADLIGHSNLMSSVEVLKDRTTDLESQMRLLERAAVTRANIIRYTPTIWPVKGKISSHYGSRPDPFNGDAEMHLGLDISALYGSLVHAPADGIVVFAQRQSAYGNLVVLDHGNGLTTRHGHLSRFNVHVGQAVHKGDVIAFVGTTGRSTAPHLHYEVRLRDRPVNPRTYLPRS